MRKAKKLAELMAWLNLGEVVADGSLTSPGSEGANACDMKFFQRTPTPAIHRSQLLPKLHSPSAARSLEIDSSSLPPKAASPPQNSPVTDTPASNVSSTADNMAAEEVGHDHQQQEHVTVEGAESSTVNVGDASADDQASKTGPVQAMHVQQGSHDSPHMMYSICMYTASI